MIAIVDVHYGDRTRAGCVVIDRWDAERAAFERTAELDAAAPYESGNFAVRELPALRAVLDGVDAAIVVVDGYVWTAPGRPGLGAVARGESARPLWVSALGMDAREAARSVAAMSGGHRLPAMILRADHLARDI